MDESETTWRRCRGQHVRHLQSTCVRAKSGTTGCRAPNCANLAQDCCRLQVQLLAISLAGFAVGENGRCYILQRRFYHSGSWFLCVPNKFQAVGSFHMDLFIRIPPRANLLSKESVSIKEKPQTSEFESTSTKESDLPNLQKH